MGALAHPAINTPFRDETLTSGEFARLLQVGCRGTGSLLDDLEITAFFDWKRVGWLAGLLGALGDPAGPVAFSFNADDPSDFGLRPQSDEGRERELRVAATL